MWQRNSPRLIAARALKALTPTVVMCLILWGLQARFDHPAVRTGITVFAVYYGLTRLSLLFTTWLTVRWRIEGDALLYRTGTLFGNVLRLPLESLVGADVRQDRYERIAGIHHVSMDTRSAGHEVIEFNALRSAELAQLLALTGVTAKTPDEVTTNPEAAGGTDTAPHKDAEVTTGGRFIEYDLPPKRMLAVSITYGKYLLLVPVLYGLYNRLGESVSLPLPQDLENLFLGLGLPAQLGIALIFVAAAVAYGYGLTYLVYGKFRIASTDDSLHVSRGLFSTQRYEVKTNEIDTLHVDQNLFMRISGQHRVAVTSRSRGETNRLKIIFPVVRYQDVEHHIHAHLPRFAISQPAISHRSNAGISILLVALKLSVGVLAAAFALTAPVPVVRYGAIVLILLVTASSINRTDRVVNVSLVNGLIRLRWGIWTTRQWTFSPRNIVALHTTTPPIPFLPSKVSISFRDGGQFPRRFALFLHRHEKAALMSALQMESITEPSAQPMSTPVRAHT